MALFAEEWPGLSQALAPSTQAAARLGEFTAKAGQMVVEGDADGVPVRVLFGLGDAARRQVQLFRALAARAPEGRYRVERAPEGLDPTEIAVAWSHGAYRYGRYKTEPSKPARLEAPMGADARVIEALSDAFALARDMVNAPANALGPAEIEAEVAAAAAAFGGRLVVVAGEALIAEGYPAVHAVGRAAAAERAPRMIELGWGAAGRPHVVLIGKGVTFDSGGLDLKPSAGMRLMKKDMGGAAHALALARMIMATDLPVRLTLLIPAVENAVSAEAMRPGDVLASRKGLSIEVGNTDAEGRLILADALTRAGEIAPDLTIDLATLTGAARVALGPEIVPFYTEDEALAAALAQASAALSDPLWRMPLWDGYDGALDSDVADLSNDAEAWAQAGSLTAALFLRRFAPKGAWVHFDIFAWNPRARPGWPKGAAVQAIRALYAVIQDRYR
jgi:leucyl aminopeptidase